jgi:hypothetical protein
MTANKKTAPYAAPENVLRALERVRQTGHKGRIDADYLRQIGINEGMISRTLGALSYLGLVAADGEPTPILERIKVGFDDEWRAVLQEAVRTSYGDIFRAVDPSADSRGKVLTAFKPMQPNKQWPRMTTLFLGLCEASGISVKEPPPNRPGKDAPTKPKERPNGRATRVTRVLTLPPPERASLDPTLTSMLGKLSEIEKPDDLDQWWSMFRTAWMFVKKVKPV